MAHAGHGASVSAAGDRRALVYAGILTGVYFVVELGIGIWSGSVAVTSDAFHTFSAVGGVLIALVAQRFSERPATLEHTFGWGRAEIIGALFNGIFLVVMAGYVMYMGAMRLLDPMHLPTNVMLATAGGGLATEVVAFWLLYERQKGNLNLKGAFWHIIQTFVGSLIIIVSAVVIRFTDFMEIDPLLGMAFGVVLFVASWSIIKEALRVLLQGTPQGFDLAGAVRMLSDIDGVEDVHHAHAWSLTSGRNLFSAHLRVRSMRDDASRVLREGTSHLKERFGVYFTTLQVEEECLPAEAGAEDIDVTGSARTSAAPAPPAAQGHTGH
ncbi:MAG TPA: cation diffusion facilitator family transporter [Dehalococcoidia bacterium]|nr:cation diffusion facilitator family transporter [Dehalococcoidia bacterium]